MPERLCRKRGLSRFLSLKGATDLLPKVDAVYVEASYVELYEGQALHEEIERFLIEAGFSLDGRFNTHVHQGEPVQADLLFPRRISSALALKT